MSRSLRVARQARRHWPAITSDPVLLMQRENAVFKVETSSGPAALRVHRAGYHHRDEVNSELAWMAHLSQSGLEVPLPHLTREGVWVAEVEDDDGNPLMVDLLSWVEGKPLGQSRMPLAHSEADLRQIFHDLGVLVADLHSVSDAWALPPGFRRHALDKEGLIGEGAAWGRFWCAVALTAAERDLVGAARERAGEQLDALPPRPASFGLIHADLVRENIFVSPGKVRIIDFDDSGFGYRMFDLAVALIKNRDEPHYAVMKRALLAGYATRREITPEDEASITLFLALRDLALLGWADQRQHEPNIAPRIPRIKADALNAAQTLLNGV
jgi:Ser/Thr protein kinase RdoA (MazF antagonist)